MHSIATPLQHAERLAHPPPAKRRRWPARRLIIAVSASLLNACAPPPPADYEAVYYLADHLEAATAAKDGSAPLSVPHLAIGFDERRAVYQQPPSAYRFAEVPAGPGARLLLAPAMNPDAWDRPTDGVTFEASCLSPEEQWVELLSFAMAPATRVEERIWHDHDLGLDACSAPATTLELRTTCGAYGNCAADWALWGDPRVIHRQPLTIRPEQLVVLISIDTLRPDRLGIYGAQRPTSNELERLAEDAIVFESAVAASPWTIPSHATMLTSTYPQVHGAGSEAPIAESAPHLAEFLSAAGWQTAGFVDTAYLGRDFGFARGFAHFDDAPPPKGDYRRGARVTRQKVLDWLLAADERPAFVFWHIMDVHGPYWAPPPFGGRFRRDLPDDVGEDQRLGRLRQLAYHDYLDLDRYPSFEHLVAAYDEGIAAVDATIGDLLDVIRAAGLYDSALIIVTSDHGESFLDHDLWVGHGLFLTDDEIRVPLVVKLPQNRRAGSRVPNMVGVIDIAPSILEAAGLQPPDTFQGRSFLADSPAAAGSPRILYGASSNTGATFLRTQSFKYISPTTVPSQVLVEKHLRSLGGVELDLRAFTSEQLYNLRRDPRELDSIAGEEVTDQLATLRAQVARHAEASADRRQGLPAAPVPTLTPEALERLRALGYVD